MAKAHKIVEGLKQAVALNGWLPIASYSDRNTHTVLIYDREWDMTEGALQIGWRMDDGNWSVGFQDFNPTHWRPLPEPPDLPEEEEDESLSTETGG